MSKDSVLNQQFESKLIHVSALGLLDSFKVPTILGVTSDVALNGLTKFGVIVVRTDAIGKTIAQLQVSSESGKIVATRVYNGTTFEDWIVPNLDATSDDNRSVGESYFNITLGKPLWKKTANEPLRAIYRFDVSAGATGAGTVTFSIGDDDYVVEMPSELSAPLTIDTIQQALDSAIPGWGVTADDEGVIFTKDVAGVADELTFVDTDTTGVAGTVAVVQEGIADVWVDAAGTIVYQ